MTITKKVLSVKRDFDMNSIPFCKFHHSQWEQCHDDKEHASLPYLLYRIVFMMILISSMTFSTLCQSYLFEIFLTNWSFTLQTLYAILSSFNILWRMRGRLFKRSFRKMFPHVYPETNAKTYELRETHQNSPWDINATTDTNSMITNEESINSLSCVNIEDRVCEDHQQQQQLNSTTTVVTTTGSPALRKPETSVIISNNNNNKNINSSNDNPPSVLEKMIWVLMNISFVLPHVVAFGYWGFVYKYDPDEKPCVRFRSHFIVHGAASVLAFIDALVVAVPARKSHFVFPSFVLLVYGVFSYIYEVSGGKYRNGKQHIYSILNWRHKPGKTVVLVIVGVIISPIMHLITCWAIHHVKLWLASCYMRRRNRK